MSRVRPGGDELIEGGGCAFCRERVHNGAYWMGSGDLWVCAICVRDGQLGKLLGDAVRDSTALEQALMATAREAWRSLALVQERVRR